MSSPKTDLRKTIEEHFFFTCGHILVRLPTSSLIAWTVWTFAGYLGKDFLQSYPEALLLVVSLRLPFGSKAVAEEKPSSESKQVIPESENEVAEILPPKALEKPAIPRAKTRPVPAIKPKTKEEKEEVVPNATPFTGYFTHHYEHDKEKNPHEYFPLDVPTAIKERKDENGQVRLVEVTLLPPYRGTVASYRDVYRSGRMRGARFYPRWSKLDAEN